jgi:hypothetical protein
MSKEDGNFIRFDFQCCYILHELTWRTMLDPFSPPPESSKVQISSNSRRPARNELRRPANGSKPEEILCQVCKEANCGCTYAVLVGRHLIQQIFIILYLREGHGLAIHCREFLSAQCH